MERTLSDLCAALPLVWLGSIHETAGSTPSHEMKLLIVKHSLQRIKVASSRAVDLNKLEAINASGKHASQANEANGKTDCFHDGYWGTGQLLRGVKKNSTSSGGPVI